MKSFSLGALIGLGEIPALTYCFSTTDFPVSEGKFNFGYVLINLSYSETSSLYLSRVRVIVLIIFLKQMSKISLLPWHMLEITAATSNGEIVLSGTEGGGMLQRHFCCGDVFSLHFFKVLGLLFTSNLLLGGLSWDIWLIIRINLF